MIITDLPLELLCVILSYIDEIETITRLLFTLNKTIINSLGVTTKKIIGDFNIKMLNMLPNIQQLSLNTTLNSLHDLYTLATLPKLTYLSVRIKPLTSTEFLETLKSFIYTHCSINRNFDQVEVEIYSGWMIFRLNKGVLKIYNKTLYIITVEEIIDLLEFSRKYLPLTTFHECFLRLWDRYDNLPTLQKLVHYLESVDELDTICIDNSPTDRFHQLFSLGKIKHLHSEVTQNDYISYLTPNPYILTFNVPIYLNQVPTLLSKYPNIQYLKLYSETEFFSDRLISPADLSFLISLPHIHSITLVTSKPSLYSSLPKILIERQGLRPIPPILNFVATPSPTTPT